MSTKLFIDWSKEYFDKIAMFIKLICEESSIKNEIQCHRIYIEMT